MENAPKETNEKLLKLAKRRVLLKKSIKWHVIIYLIINAFLCVVYYLTTPDGYFWPMWSMAGWGLGLIVHVVVVCSVLSSTRNRQNAVEKEYQMLQKDYDRDSD